jgi:hypothetical protein
VDDLHVKRFELVGFPYIVIEDAGTHAEGEGGKSSCSIILFD